MRHLFSAAVLALPFITAPAHAVEVGDHPITFPASAPDTTTSNAIASGNISPETTGT